MKYFIMTMVAIVTIVIATEIYAGEPSPSQADIQNSAVSGSFSGSVAVAKSNGQVNSNNSVGSDLSKMVPAVSAPSLTTTLTETCMGSTSFGGAGAGFGFSFGTTWRDSACVRRLDARQLAAFNDMPTAREIMCASSIVREAALRAGRPCVEDGGIVAYDIRQTMQNPPQEVAEVTVEDAAAVMRMNPPASDNASNDNRVLTKESTKFLIETPQ